MKKIKFLTFCVLIVTTAIHAQDVQDQNEIIRNNASKGDYKIIADRFNSNWDIMTVVDISPDKSQPDGHFEIKLKENPNHAAESTRNEVIQLFSDNIAFPVTYRSTAYAGNAKLQEAVGYVIDKKESDRWDKRYIFVKDYLFIVTDWKSKDDYYIRYILKSKNAPADKTEKKEKKKKKGFFKVFERRH